MMFFALFIGFALGQTGKCGDTEAICKWSYANKKLTITGKEMDGWTSDTQPYRAHLKDIEEVVIEGNFTEIAQNAFNNFHNLKKVTMPDTIKTIAESAFDGCMSLKEITLSKNLTKIGNSAFSSCNGLPSITIPDTVEEIGNSAFSGCLQMNTIVLGSGLKKIDQYAFSGFHQQTVSYSGTGANLTCTNDVFSSNCKFITVTNACTKKELCGKPALKAGEKLPDSNPSNPSTPSSPSNPSSPSGNKDASSRVSTFMLICFILFMMW